MENTFSSCWVRNCLHVANNCIYRCPRTYAGLKMGLFKEKEVQGDYISLSDISFKKDMRRRLQELYSALYIKTCSACLEENQRKTCYAAKQL